MDNYFLNQLSSHTRLLVDEIEKALPHPIEVLCRAEFDHLGCSYDAMHACILAPRLDRLPEGSVIHELLHLKRLAVEGISRLDATIDDPQFIRSVDKLDNAIEHLFIVPEEIRRWPSRKGYWGKVLHRELREVGASKAPAVDISGHSILCCALAKRAVPSDLLLNGWSNYLDAMGQKAFVDVQVQQILATQSKKIIVDLMLNVYRIPSGCVELN